MKFNLMRPTAPYSSTVEIVSYEVQTTAEFYAILRKEFKFSPSCNVAANLTAAPYDKFITPRARFPGVNYGVILKGFDLIGWCDQPLESLIQEDEILPKDNPQNKEFFIVEDGVEHSCCWSSMIRRKSSDKDGENFVECNRQHAKFICDALNEKWEKENNDSKSKTQ